MNSASYALTNRRRGPVCISRTTLFQLVGGTKAVFENIGTCKPITTNLKSGECSQLSNIRYYLFLSAMYEVYQLRYQQRYHTDVQ